MWQIIWCLPFLFSPIEIIPDWGFYGHRLINKMAVYTLPTELIGLYKPHLDYVESHAVDPDKRRYAVIGEAERHYIDIDHWGEDPFEIIPKIYVDAVMKYGNWKVIRGDTMQLYGFDQWNRGLPNLAVHSNDRSYILDVLTLRDSVSGKIYNRRLESPWQLIINDEKDSLHLLLYDEFSAYGILPYALEQEQRRLTKAFIDKDIDRIIKVSTTFAHYIADAHVPLHTTVNYNGQLTNQLGIHAFWESRIPELFAESEYDFFVGKAKYIDDTRSFFWKTIEESHALVLDVLRLEKELSMDFPESQQFCYEDRLDQNVRIQCPAYAKAYESALKGTVEKRMQASILAIGSCWYTAWVDAGQPIFDKVSIPLLETVKFEQNPKIRTGIRPHE